MRITRREFINAASVSSIIVAAGGFTRAFGQKSGVDEGYPIPPETYSHPVFSMTAAQLSDFIGHRFTVTRQGLRPIALVLAQVNVLEREENKLRGFYGECFSLIFEGQAGRQLGQAIYVLETDGLGPFTALVVPIGLERTRYEVIINHITR